MSALLRQDNLPIRRRALSGVGAAAVREDHFSLDTTAHYTFAQDSGSPTAAIGEGVLTLTSPDNCQSTYTRNLTSILDGYVEADINSAQDSGLVFRWQNQSNFYLLALSDDSGSNISNNLVLYVRSGGSFTLLGTYGFSWTRGTQQALRLTASGSTISAQLNGATVISASNSTIATAGKVGVRGNGPGSTTTNNKFNALRWG